MATAEAITEAIQEGRANGKEFDLLFFGNESANTGGYQVGVRVAHALGLPCVTGIKELEIQADTAIAKHATPDGWETYELPLPAVFTIKEGINLPRYPSLRGKLQAKKKEIKKLSPKRKEEDLRKVRLKNPEREETKAEILGEGPEAAQKVLELLNELGVMQS